MAPKVLYLDKLIKGLSYSLIYMFVNKGNKEWLKGFVLTGFLLFFSESKNSHWAITQRFYDQAQLHTRSNIVWMFHKIPNISVGVKFMGTKPCTILKVRKGHNILTNDMCLHACICTKEKV